MARKVARAPPAALVLDGRSSPKRRRASGHSISKEQELTFFATLAETCNVVRSAKAAGISTNGAYRRRKRDAAFRNHWTEAVREGYARLELVLLERAIKGTPKLVRSAKGGDRMMRDYRMMVSGASDTIERDYVEEQALLTATEIASLGAGPLDISVRQIGAFALSRPRTITVN